MTNMTQRKIDLRSDTVTRPTADMLDAMMQAEVGDDVYGDDPTVNQLESRLASMTGKQSGLFCPSGTQSNLLALLSHCDRGDEYIVGQTGHTYKYEGGGAAVFGSIQPQPVDFDERGCLPLDKVDAAIKPVDSHFARTRLLCLENTQWGRPLPMDYLEEAGALARRRGLATHLDGARVFNASVKLGVPVQDICEQFDSVSICLSKGLGCPVGSVLVGSDELIDKARRWRKVAGGGMRQAGILAAAGLYALEHNVERLADDHSNAERLAAGLRHIEGYTVDTPATNMVYVHDAYGRADELKARLENEGVVVTSGSPMRLVTHLDLSANDVDHVVAAFNRVSSIIAVEAVG